MRRIVAACIALSLILVGCSSPSNQSNTYQSNAMSKAQRTIEGKILSKRQVTVKGGSGIGTSSGAMIGGISGSSLGSNANDSAVGAIAGAVVGGTLGAIAQSEAFATQATEYIVESQVAGILTIVINDSSLNKGDDVFIILGREPKLILRDSK